MTEKLETQMATKEEHFELLEAIAELDLLATYDIGAKPRGVGTTTKLLEMAKDKDTPIIVHAGRWNRDYATKLGVLPSEKIFSAPESEKELEQLKLKICAMSPPLEKIALDISRDFHEEILKMLDSINVKVYGVIH